MKPKEVLCIFTIQKHKKLITMGRQRISELPPIESALTGSERFPLIVELSPGVYKTYSATINDLPIPEPEESVNIMYNDLTATGNRYQDMDGYIMEFDNGSQFKFTTNVAPPAGQASHDFRGYGTTASDILWRVRTGGGGTAVSIDGARNSYFNGNLYSYHTNFMETIRSPFFTSSGISISNGVKQVSRGEIGLAYASHVFDSANIITNSGARIFEFWNGDDEDGGTLLFSMNKDGVLKTSGTPIGNSGLVTGQVYMDSAANVLSNSDLVLAVKQ